MISHSVQKGLSRHHWPDEPDRPGTYGIITTATGEFAHDLELLYGSITRYKYPLHIFSYPRGGGLPPWLLEKLSRDPLVSVTQLEDTYGEHNWPHLHFQKHEYLAKSPFLYSLWIDCDCVVTGELKTLFALLMHQPIITADWMDTERLNPPALYDVYPVSQRSPVPINAGVVGMMKGRDDELLRSWSERCLAALKDPTESRLYHWHDQGALLWAVEHNDKAHCILHDRRWNRPARRILYRPDNLLDQIIEAHPDTNIAHFIGPDKPHRLTQVVPRHYDTPPRPQRVLIMGLERSGLRALARALQHGASDYAWVRHGTDVVPGWPDQYCVVSVYAGPRCHQYAHTALGADPDTKFIILLRNPVNLIQSRFRSGAHWSGQFHRLPIFLQHHLRQHGPITPLEEPTPPPGALLEQHTWATQRQLVELTDIIHGIPPDQFLVLHTAELSRRSSDIARFLGKDLFDRATLCKHLQPPEEAHAAPLVQWADAMTRGHEAEISSMMMPYFEIIKSYCSTVIDHVPLSHITNS